MSVRTFTCRAAAPAFLALLALGAMLGGCASVGDNVSTAFADPAKYELWDCKQLEPERKRLATRSAELEGLMAKAETGVAGPLVAEMAYRNEHIAVRGQARFADEAWQRNRCREGASAGDSSGAPPVRPKFPSPPKSGSAVY
ncbi:MAG: twin-arginine translocation pathway signal [Bradyrhizobium sp.]|uniref:twin-arginine translocation pathway signal n=1 Tax=Bradyrhizobium sp. TaxID=376 RepID=UPI0025BE8511|nr:twin-arginine translocation pathway signal [Bradyrhizobium sp.]MBI5264428.1 twin-arginine translocation pathway signal [Bradyrhizobium sp.]